MRLHRKTSIEGSNTADVAHSTGPTLILPGNFVNLRLLDPATAADPHLWPPLYGPHELDTMHAVMDGAYESDKPADVERVQMLARKGAELMAAHHGLTLEQLQLACTPSHSENPSH